VGKKTEVETGNITESKRHGIGVGENYMFNKHKFAATQDKSINSAVTEDSSLLDYFCLFSTVTQLLKIRLTDMENK
jgi:hypothetical protein